MTVEGIPAKRFKELIDGKRQAFSRGTAQWTLPFTGVKIEELGPAAIAARWLAGDQRVIEHLRAADEVKEGGPMLITKLENRPSLKAALVQRLVQAGAAIVKSNLAPTSISEQNTRTNALVQGYVDPALGLKPFATGVESRLDYILAKNDLWLEIQVSTV